MKIKELISLLENEYPLSSQADFDNCGLLVGDQHNEITSVLISLDCTEDIIDEAIQLGANVIVSHHPIVFKGLKKITGKNYVERTLLKAIKNDIAIYAIHTNLDHHIKGVNYEIAKRLGLENLSILDPVASSLYKLVVFIPQDHVSQVERALFHAGAGQIGNYSECSFEHEGIGSFTPGEEASPFEGSIGKRTKQGEIRLEVLVNKHKLAGVLQAMNESHPYEEVAHDIIPISNYKQDEGSGMLGELEKPMDTIEFLNKLKETFNCSVIRHTNLVKKKVQTVALCGGAGSFLLSKAISKKADIFITGDFKYHEFFDAENKLIIADIGHYESEQFTINLLHRELSKKINKFAIHITGINTNPINYF